MVHGSCLVPWPGAPECGRCAAGMGRWAQGHGGSSHVRPQRRLSLGLRGISWYDSFFFSFFFFFFKPLHSFLMCVAAQLLAAIQRARKAQLPDPRLEKELQSTFFHSCVDSFHSSLTEFTPRNDGALREMSPPSETRLDAAASPKPTGYRPYQFVVCYRKTAGPVSAQGGEG